MPTIIKSKAMKPSHLSLFLLFSTFLCQAQVTADFTWTGAQCSGSTILFSDASSGDPGSTWDWQINGETFNIDGSYKEYTFPDITIPTDFEVIMTVHAGTESDEIAKIIRIHPNPEIPVLAFGGSPTFCDGESVRLVVDNNPDIDYQWLQNNILIEGATSYQYEAKTSGEYVLEVSNSDGCLSKSELVSVLVLPAPKTPVISLSGTTSFCIGDSVVLSVDDNSDLTYQWKLNSGDVGTDKSTFSAKYSGNYTLTVTNDMGCSRSSSNSALVTVNPAPERSSISINGSTTFCEGDSLLMGVTENPLYSYQWLNDGNFISGANAGRYRAKASGSYILNVTNSSGCSIQTYPVNVEVISVPEIPTINLSGPSTFCEGDSIILSIEDQELSVAYAWKRNGLYIGNNSIIMVVKTIGEYSLVASNTYSCQVESENIFVEVNPGPADFWIQGNNVVDKNEIIEYTVPENTDLVYTWTVQNGSILSRPSNNRVEIEWEESGEGVVFSSAVNLYGCISDTMKLQVSVGGSSAIQQESIDGIILYPNPSRDQISIHFPNPNHNRNQLKLFDMSGKELRRIDNISDEEYFIERNGLESGQYIIELKGPQIYRSVVEFE